MKGLYVSCFSFLFLLQTPLFAQTKFHSGLEVGVSFSQFAFNENSNNVLLAGKYYTSTERDVPVFSPLIGLSVQYELMGNWVLDGAFQYQMTGRKLVENAFVTENAAGGTPVATDDFTEKQTFHKLAIPLALGYNADIGKRKLGFLVGFRVNRLILGKYSLDNVHKSGLVSSTVNAKTNPFDTQIFSTSPNRNVNQVFAAVCFRFTDRLETSVRMNISSNNIEYTAKDGTLCISGDCGKKMRGDDFQFVVRYYFKD
jgi:Outer membrane protein beta-barrel domain